MMHKTMLALMIALTAATPAQAERFAISCRGPAALTITEGRRTLPLRASQATVVYVIDTDARTVYSVGKDNGALSELCTDEKIECTRSFTADRITLSGASTTTEGTPPVESRRVIEFTFDRQRNRVESLFTMASSDGASIRGTRTMRCKTVDIPTPRT